MGLAERFARLEEEVTHLRAVVDGGEAQARETIVIAFGLMADFAARSGALDLDRLIDFLSAEADPNPSWEDKIGMLIHGMRLILIFHRDLGAGTLEPLEPVTDALTELERLAILRRAEAMVAFDRETGPRAGTDPSAGLYGTNPSGH